MSGKPLCPHCGCTEDEREQVRREALEEAAKTVEARDAFLAMHQKHAYDCGRDRAGEEALARRQEAACCASDIRAIADRSEPRQEKEGHRG